MSAYLRPVSQKDPRPSCKISIINQLISSLSCSSQYLSSVNIVQKYAWSLILFLTFVNLQPWLFWALLNRLKNPGITGIFAPAPAPSPPEYLYTELRPFIKFLLGHLSNPSSLYPVFTCFLQLKKIIFGVLLLNHYQNSNMVLESHHNIPNLLFLPLLQLSSVIKCYLKSFKNRNRAESNFSIQMSLFKLTVL